MLMRSQKPVLDAASQNYYHQIGVSASALHIALITLKIPTLAYQQNTRQTCLFFLKRVDYFGPELNE